MEVPSSLRDWLLAVVESALRELPDQNVWQHAAENIFLGGHQALVHRFYDPELTPYAKLFQEAATGQFTNIHVDDWWIRSLVERGQSVEEFFCIKSSQSGFTQAAINIIVFVTRFLSGRGLYCIDSKEKAGRLCKLRLLPLLEKLCAGQISGKEDDLGTHWLELTNWVWEMVGSYSSAVFSEKPLTMAMLDDVEYMVTESGKRGFIDGVHVCDHARSRFTTADRHFLGVFTKPDLEDSYVIGEARGGSLHSWLVPCPHCNFAQTLELKSLFYNKAACRDLAGRYDLDAVEQLTTVRCAKCEKEIEEKWKAPMNAAGFALPKSKEDRDRDGDPPLVPRRMSFRVNDLVSPWIKWGQLGRMLIEAENNPAKLRFIYTNHGAVPWREKAINLKAEHIRALIAGRKMKGSDYIHGSRQGVLKPYRRGECPFVPIAVTATSDRQGDKLKWTLCGWQLDGSCSLIEYGATLAEADLLKLCETPVNHESRPIVCLSNPDLHLFAGFGLDGGGALIDSGFETWDVYDFCAASGWRWYPSKGVKGLTEAATGYLFEGKRDFKDGREILRYNYHDYALKVAFYKGKIEAHSHPKPEKRKPSNLLLPEDIGDDFIVELISESLQPRKLSTGGTKMEWFHDEKIGPNDWGDAMKTQLVLWQVIMPFVHAKAALRLTDFMNQIGGSCEVERFDRELAMLGPSVRSFALERRLCREAGGVIALAA